MYGKLTYDPFKDLLCCDFPVRDQDGKLVRCGEWRKNLAKHITRQHKISTREYKKMLGLNLNLPLVSKDLQAKWRKANKDQKLYLNLEKGKPYRLKKGETTIQNYSRSTQTKRRLRTLRWDLKKNKINI
jgi:hypothetical protein